MHSTENYQDLPSTFAEAIGLVNNFARQEMHKESEQKQLYYHNIEHINGVERRANQIFQAIKPYWEKSLSSESAPDYLARMELLLNLCAIAHDMVQEFVPQTQPHTTRKREAGVSETATIDKLMAYIKNLNERLSQHNPHSAALFNDSDLQIITGAIEATICLYDPADASIYQPDLYNPDKDVSIVARIIALADIGGLGMEGIEAYNQEGSVLFLEENPDIIPIILNSDLNSYPQDLRENIRERMLRRAKFQINFAKGRVARYPREVEGLPADAIPVLTEEVFKYLNQETIKELQSTTPTADDTTLEKLIEFFDFRSQETGVRRQESGDSVTPLPKPKI